MVPWRASMWFFFLYLKCIYMNCPTLSTLKNKKEPQCSSMEFSWVFFFFFNFCDLSLLSFFFLSVLHAMWDLSSWPGIEPRLPAVETQSHNHWTTREVPILDTEYGLITLKWLSKCYLGSTDSLIWSWEHESLASVFLSSEIQYILGEHHWLFFPFHKEKIFE